MLMLLFFINTRQVAGELNQFTGKKNLIISLSLSKFKISNNALQHEQQKI